MEHIPWSLAGFVLGLATAIGWYKFDRWRKWNLILKAVEGPNVSLSDGFRLHDGGLIRRPKDKPPNVIQFPPKEAA